MLAQTTKVAARCDHLKKLLVEKVQQLEQENEKRTQPERAEKAMMNMASELQAATETVRAQGKQIEAL